MCLRKTLTLPTKVEIQPLNSLNDFKIWNKHMQHGRLMDLDGFGRNLTFKYTSNTLSIQVMASETQTKPTGLPALGFSSWLYGWIMVKPLPSIKRWVASCGSESGLPLADWWQSFDLRKVCLDYSCGTVITWFWNSQFSPIWHTSLKNSSKVVCDRRNACCGTSQDWKEPIHRFWEKGVLSMI